MSVEAVVPGRVAVRREQTRRAILDAAWSLASGAGLEALSLREIGASVGMRAPSLYSYFPSKGAILDAMFVEGYQALDAEIVALRDALPARASAHERLARLLTVWGGFCQVDPARYGLLFTAAMPGWSPSERAYAASLSSYQTLGEYLALAGVTDPDDVDLCTALSAGLVAQQMANDPHGDRWLRRVDDVVGMFLAYVAARRRLAARRLRGRS